MHSGIQHGMQHRKPVAQNKIAPQASAVPPTFVLSITLGYYIILIHNLLYLI
jgi:hypothetical protein